MSVIRKSTAPPNNRAWFPVLALFVATFVALLVIFTDSGRELTPRHENDKIWALVISIGLGCLCFAVMTGWPPRLKVMGRAALWALLVGFVWVPVTGITIWRVHEIIDFTGHPITQQDRSLPIDRASVHHGRGISYTISLRDYPVSLDLDKADYRAAFGDAEHVRPEGYCIRATLQSAGPALRIMADDGLSLPPGSLEHCPKSI